MLSTDRKKMHNRKTIELVCSALLLSSAAVAQTSIPAAGLCNTGLTPASPLPTGCTTSTLVTPVNPQSGGTSVDGNWQLATPYPSASYTHQAPNPCSLTRFGPAWVDTTYSGWFNPNDGLSQWITPEVDEPSAAGWFIYRTAFPIPPISSPSTYYVLTVTGQVMGDNATVAIYLENPSTERLSCKTVALPAPEAGSGGSGWAAWNPFSFASKAVPNTSAYVYVLVYNAEGSSGNATGLRLEFTSANLTPE
jgi:hypothetical protein